MKSSVMRGHMVPMCLPRFGIQGETKVVLVAAREPLDQYATLPPAPRVHPAARRVRPPPTRKGTNARENIIQGDVSSERKARAETTKIDAIVPFELIFFCSSSLSRTFFFLFRSIEIVPKFHPQNVDHIFVLFGKEEWV